MPLRSEKKAPNLKPVVDPNNPVKPGFWPASVAFWDAENGLLAGRLYRDEGRSRSDGAVAMTHDGGTSWRLAYRTNSQVDGLAVVGERTAFATLGYGNTKIITTGDSGRTWKDWPGSQELSQPSFQTPETGWAVSDRGLMAWSSGRWAPIPDPCEGVVVDLSFPEGGDGRGWLACSFEGGAGQEPKAIYETTDAGRSWDLRAGVWPIGWGPSPGSSPGSGLSGYGYVSAISFLPDGSGWLAESRGTFYSTDDGGSSWRQHVGFQQPEVAFGTSVWQVDDLTGFVLEDRREMVLHVSHDGGASWSRVAAFRANW
jgi:photosystem II stability/assembly factor-like uncharacterized protein